MNVIADYARVCFKKYLSLHIFWTTFLGKELIYPPKIYDDLVLVIYT